MDHNNLTIPNHIAFIMDGNGRWAKRRFLPRTIGHKHGVDSLRKVIKKCYNLGVKYVSIFAFSTENWKRPTDEVNEIFRLIEKALKDNLNKFIEKGIRLHHSGSIENLPKSLQNEINNSIKLTKDCNKLTINVCLNYGGRKEIVDVVNKLIENGKKRITIDDINNNLCSNIPEPDIIVRTSGEQRISNFMLWQMAYSELYFTKELWPDINDKSLNKIILEYNKRKRRFGKVI